MSHLRLRRLAGRQLGDEKEEAATAAHNLEANACGDVRRAHCGAEGLAGGRLAASLGRRRAPGRWAGLTEVERAGGAGRGEASPQLVHDSEALLQPLRGAGTPLSPLARPRGAALGATLGGVRACSSGVATKRQSERCFGTITQREVAASTPPARLPGRRDTRRDGP